MVRKKDAQTASVKIYDQFYFRRQFETLQVELCNWLETSTVAALEDFDEELPLDVMFHWYESRMNRQEIAYLRDFINRWEKLAETTLSQQICGDCGEYTLDCFWKLYAGRMLCRTCRKLAETTTQTESAAAQQSLF
ncbi:MAG TPA: hypothetical protein VK308_14500, partial [Pyrinomonadaceae bacterium]|nr:hypothetical protein [Pyrinomonadaceae bacterium]